MATETVTRTADTNGSRPETTRTGGKYLPNVDIYETPGELWLVADVPGAKRDEIDVHFENGTLTIHAPVTDRRAGGAYLLQEYGVGDFHRTFQVAETIDPGSITAQYSAGVLKLRLPKVPKAQARKISVGA